MRYSSGIEGRTLHAWHTVPRPLSMAVYYMLFIYLLAAGTATPATAEETLRQTGMTGDLIHVDVRYSLSTGLFSVNESSAFGPIAATIEVNASYHTTGWDEVTVTLARAFVEPKCGDMDARMGLEKRLQIAYEAAGYAEGYATQPRINAYLHNTWDGPLGLGRLVSEVGVKEWIHRQMSFLDQVSKDPASGAYGVQLGRFLALLRGLTLGYTARADRSGNVGMALPDPLALLYLNLQAEIGDIINAIHKDDVDSLRRLRQLYPLFMVDQHCSALVKLVPGVDLFFSHVTWNTFESMIRQVKTYVLEGVPGTKHERRYVSMSSYPGMVASLDDWYMTHSGLAVMETSNMVFDTSIFKFNQPESVPAFLRAMLANVLATANASHWVDLFGMLNSGTYNNQWMVMNMAAIPSMNPEELPEGVFIVAEQLPAPAPTSLHHGDNNGTSPINYTSFGLTIGDMSTHLREHHYWASYNVPYFPEVYHRSGFFAKYMESGDEFSHLRCARAQIFAREQAAVQDLSGVQKLMRWGKYTTDPLSRIKNCSGAGDDGSTCSPPYSSMLTISSRGDLNPPGGVERYGPEYLAMGHRDHGGTDAKITSWRGMRGIGQGASPASAHRMKARYVAHVVCGPTTDSVPPFRWNSTRFDPMPSILGLPEVFNYSFIRVEAGWAPTPSDDVGPGHRDRQNRTLGFWVGVVSGILAAASLIYLIIQAFRLRQEVDHSHETLLS